VQDFVSFALLGLGAGAVYTLLAQGLLVMYRASGVLNFAIGSQAMLGAYIHHALRGDNGDKMAQVPAVILAVLASGAIGVVIFLLVMQPLAQKAPLVRITAALSVLLLIQTGATMHWGGDVTFVTGFLPSQPRHILGTTLGEDRLWLFGIAVFITLVLAIGYRYTVGGRATEAVATNPRLAATLGWSPKVVGAANWFVGSAIAGFAGIVITPLTGLQVSRLTLLVIPALAVAMVAGFSNFGLTLLAGVLLGIVESELTGHVTNIQGIGQAAPLVLIVIILTITGRGIPTRDFAHDRLPGVGNGIPRLHTLVVSVLVAIGLLFLAPTNYVVAVTMSIIACFLLVSIVVVTGFAGQLSLAQWAIAGVAAFTSGRIIATTTHTVTRADGTQYSVHNFPFEIALVLGVLSSMVVGALFALPALRARGATLAVMTLGLGQALYAVVFTNSKYTGQLNGTVVGGQTFFGIDIDPITHPARYGTLCGILLLAVIFVASSIRRSRAGRRLLSVRENERAAAALGINVTTSKLYAFTVASGIAGLGGVMFAFASHSVVYSFFDSFTSIIFVTFAVLAGIGYISGQPFVALVSASGGVATLIFNEHHIDSSWVTIVGSVLTIITLIQYPDGIAGAGEVARRRRQAKLARKALKAEAAGKHVKEAKGQSALSKAITQPVLFVSKPAEIHEGTAAEILEKAPKATPKVLDMQGITVRFGGVTALSEVNFSAGPGEIVGLIGPNGAGKTTLIDVASGFVKSSEGTVTLGGEDITHASRHHRANAGLSRSFQSLELFDDLTVRENLLAAADGRDSMAWLSNLVKSGSMNLPPAAEAAVAVFGLEKTLDKRPTELPYGRRRLVAIARAAATAPSVILLDEPAAGLGRDQADELSELIRVLARQIGQAVVLVEHDLEMVLQVSDRLVVLDRGRLLAAGEPQATVALPEVRAAYLGHEEGMRHEELADEAGNLDPAIKGQ
jgi:sulfate-transporting ATPase